MGGCESRLHTDRTPHGLYRAGELDQEAVAGSLNESTVVLLDLGLNHVAPQRPDPSEGPFFVLAHKLREPNHIGGKDRCEAASGHSGRPRALNAAANLSFMYRLPGVRSKTLATVILGNAWQKSASVRFASSTRPA